MSERSTPAAAGLIVVDKPSGTTSRRVVDAVARALGMAAVGHAGTLDPLARGVMLVCVGHATRLVDFLHEVTGDPRLLESVAPALRWMRTSLLPDGRLARFYELRTNRPLYLTRDTYELTYDDDRLPTHYSFSKKPRLEELERRYAAVRDGRAVAETPSLKALRRDAERIVDDLDATGRWLATADDRPWPHAERRDTPGRDAAVGPFISSALFARNLTRLADYVAAAQAAAAERPPASR